MSSSRDLEHRVKRLEIQVAALAARLPADQPIPEATPAAPPPFIPPPASEPVDSGRRRGIRTDLEVSLVGTWFARLGAVALIVGAAFGFKYAIDKGAIGPWGRVAIGILAGLTLLGWGERARRRSWDPLAQAVTAGGIALLYLSILVAVVLYELIGLPLAVAALTVVAAAGGALALRHDSVALATLASLCAFINAALMASTAEAGALFAYIAVLDLAVLGLAVFKRWRTLNLTALAGTWILFGATVASANFGLALAFASLFFLIFSSLPLMQSRRHGGVKSSDVTVVVSAGFLYCGFALELLERSHVHWQGGFAVVVALAYLGLAHGARKLAPADRLLSLVMPAMSVAMITLAIALQFEGDTIPLAWSIEAAVLALVGRRTGDRWTRWGAMALTGLSFVGAALLLFVSAALILMVDSEGERVLLSSDDAPMVIHIAAFYCTGWLLAAREERGWSGRGPSLAGILASLLTLMWLGIEAVTYFEYLLGEHGQATQFTLSAIIALYGSGLLAVGVATGLRWARLLAVGLFAAAIGKMFWIDLWLLSSSYRMIAFIGLGGLLLLSSLGYNRFRELVTGPPETSPPPSPSG